jgi:hypothetical protein
MKPITSHLDPAVDLAYQKPNHILVGRIRHKQRLLQSVEAENIQMLRRL